MQEAEATSTPPASAEPEKVCKLNRSKKWPYAETYAEARKMSPFPERTVR